MGKPKLFSTKIHLVVMPKKMVFFIRVLWVYFFTSVFGFIGRLIFRLQEKLVAQDCIITREKQECNIFESGTEQGKGEKSESLLRFHFPTFEEFAWANNSDFITDQVLCHNSDDDRLLNVAKNDTVSSNCSMVQKPVEGIILPPICSESNMITISDELVFKSLVSIENPSEMITNLGGGIVEPLRDATGSLFDSEINESIGDLISDHAEIMEENSKEIESKIKSSGEPSKMVNDLGNSLPIVSHRTPFLSNDESLVLDSDSDSIVSSISSSRSSFIDSDSDGFLCDIDFQKGFESSTLTEYGWKEVKLSSVCSNEEDIQLQHLSKGYCSDDLDDKDENLLLELKKIEEDVDNFDTDDGISVESDSLSEQRFESLMANSDLVDVNSMKDIEKGIDMESMQLGEPQPLVLNLVHDGLSENKMDNDSENKQSLEKSSSDSDEHNGLEREWEHQDLVEQLKTEIRKVRAIGLPTILEESTSPKIMDDLKPWKIENKYQHEGNMDELHKFYRGYRERMRKLDILNFQKMYAIGFLKQKDPLQSFTRNKIYTQPLSTIVSFDCWPYKPKLTSEVHEPLMKKFSRELERDLEMVYVGQMCLAWEFLRWEYGKALDLWEYDPHRSRCYNEAADKFQMFQVLLTRFLENEPFQGPRVQHYVMDRCVLRDLLQVPLVRDDKYRDRKKESKGVSGKDAITSLQLVEIIEQSISVLWQFIRSDKESRIATLMKYRWNSNVDHHNSADACLFEDVRSSLQKKDKKLKELTRSENCILRKFRRHLEDGSDNVLHFFSQVDMKLVARVLNMSRISTEQLVWCSNKLNKINFEGIETVKPKVKTSILELTGFSESDFPFRYLGHTLNTSRLTIDMYKNWST